MTGQLTMRLWLCNESVIVIVLNRKALNIVVVKSNLRAGIYDNIYVYSRINIYC